MVFTDGIITKKYTPSNPTVSSTNSKNCSLNYKLVSPINCQPSNSSKASSGKMKRLKCNKTFKSLTDCFSKHSKNPSPPKAKTIFIRTLSKITLKANSFITQNVINVSISPQDNKISKISS